MSEKLKRAHNLMLAVVEDFFRDGDMTYDKAYALTVLAIAYIEKFRETHHYNYGNNIKAFEEGLADQRDWVAIIFPTDDTIRKHLQSLEKLQHMLSGSCGERGVMLHISKDPFLKLVPPRDAKKDTE